MLIQVKRTDGKTETISIESGARVRHSQAMNVIQNPSGLDHFFMPDGSYDGWGGAVPKETTPEEAVARITEIERHRSVS